MPDRAYRRGLDKLIGQAFREAEALGYGVVGPEEFILAILAGANSPARTTLEYFGITHDALAGAVSTALAEADPPLDPRDRDASTTNPAAHELMGRAEGIAVGFGAPAVTPEHVLIAFVWDDSGALGAWFEVPRESVLEQLAQLGVRVPDGPLPPPPPPSGPRIFIPYDESDAIIGELLTRLPADSRFGCNHDEKSRAWVVARAEVDLAAYVAEVLDDLGLEPVPQPDGPR
jgi:hypothetical protein